MSQVIDAREFEATVTPSRKDRILMVWKCARRVVPSGGYVVHFQSAPDYGAVHNYARVHCAGPVAAVYAWTGGCRTILVSTLVDATLLALRFD